MRRLLGAAAIALTLGCLDTGTGNALAPIWVPSSYQLEAVDGVLLPVPLTTADGQTHLIEHDSLALRTDYTFFHARQVTHPTGAQTITDDGPFTVTREGRVVISEEGQMLTGMGSPVGNPASFAAAIEFNTTAASAYGVHRYRFVRTAP